MKMLKLAFFNFIKCLKYIFIPMLCYALGILISTIFEAHVNDISFQDAFSKIMELFIHGGKAAVKTDVNALMLIDLSIIVGYFFTRYAIRRQLAKRSLKMAIIMFFVDLIIVGGSMRLIKYLSSLWPAGGLLTSILSLLIMGFMAMTEAYIVHHKKGDNMRKYINTKNVILLCLGNVIVYSIASLICYGIRHISNDFIYTFFQMPIYLISATVMTLNAESYIVECNKESLNITSRDINKETKAE